MKRTLTICSSLILLSGCSSIPQLNPEYWKQPEVASILIEAGHEGRTSGRTGAESKYGKEQDWTKTVADEANEVLKKAGISVIRTAADRKRRSEVQLAVAIHFDGVDGRECGAGASVGYENNSNPDAATTWKSLYSQYFKFKWMPDNYTETLSNYYTYKLIKASDANLVLELGDINCDEQAKWLQPRLKQIGALVAHFSAMRLGKAELVPLPAELAN